MGFLEFFHKIAPILKGKQSNATFVRELFENITDYENSEGTPLDQSDDTFRFYVDKRNPINQLASDIAKNIDVSRFANYIAQNNDEAIENLFYAFQDDLENSTIDSFPDDLAALFSDIILEASKLYGTKRNTGKSSKTKSPVSSAASPITPIAPEAGWPASLYSQDMTAPYYMPPPLIMPVAAKPMTGTVSDRYYNLFVLPDDHFHDPVFVIPKEKALTDYMDNILRAKFSTLSTPKIKDEICSFPSLFAKINQSNGHTDESQNIDFGFVTQIEIKSDGVHISHVLTCRFPQQFINKNLSHLGIWGDFAYNELNTVHWRIIENDLIKRLNEIGIIVSSNQK